MQRHPSVYFVTLVACVATAVVGIVYALPSLPLAVIVAAWGAVGARISWIAAERASVVGSGNAVPRQAWRIVDHEAWFWALVGAAVSGLVALPGWKMKVAGVAVAAVGVAVVLAAVARAEDEIEEEKRAAAQIDRTRVSHLPRSSAAGYGLGVRSRAPYEDIPVADWSVVAEAGAPRGRAALTALPGRSGRMLGPAQPASQ